MSSSSTNSTIVDGKSQYIYRYSLDVVTNGSEALEPTVFLSVSRRSRNVGDDVDSSTEEAAATSLVRYAILGLSDMTARLVADQKLSWANTMAVFSHNNHRHGVGAECCQFVNVNGGGLWGLPSILQALNQAGVPELTVVAGNEEDASCTEEIVQMLQGRKAHPQVLVSAVPLSKKSGQGASWWKLYEDPYLIVHGTCPDKLEHLIYLFTCRRHETISNYTVALLPCPHSWQVFLDIWSIPESRVLLETDQNSTMHSLPLRIRMVLSGGEDTAKRQQFVSGVQALLPKAEVFFCQNQHLDNGILLRAKSLLNPWHKVFPSNIIWRQPPNDPSHQSNGALLNGTKMASCTSVLCTESADVVDRKPTIMGRITEVVPAADDIKALGDFLGASEDQNKGDGAVDPDEIILDDLNDDLSENSGNQIETGLLDGNEIDVDDTSSPQSEPAADFLNDRKNEHETITAKSLPHQETSTLDCPHLLVLGTGCAAPSPVRGSSGYGLMLPQMLDQTGSTCAPLPEDEALLLTAIIECGEGTLTMLLRHLPSVSSIADDKSLLQVHLRHVKLIWISHAHLDHYGGLPAVVSNIYRARMKHHHEKQLAKHSSKRSRVEPSDPPVLVVAPRKVLDYLAIALGEQHGDIPSPRLFQGYTHEQPRSWWPALASTQIGRVGLQPNTESHYSYAYRPFSFWTNVRVEHSCYKAFGFVMGIRVPGHEFAGDQCGVDFTNSGADGNRIVTLAYSGDTRPCWGFVQRCRTDCASFSRGTLDYLLHEASFDDTDQAQAVEKKHSSLSEALKVAEQTSSQNLILTHFSQRYCTYPPMKLPPVSSLNKTAVVFAMDGLLLPLPHLHKV